MPLFELGRLRLFFYNQWTLGNNWYDFTIINLSGEYSPYKESVEISWGLLGLNFTIDFFYGKPYVEGEE